MENLSQAFIRYSLARNAVSEKLMETLAVFKSISEIPHD